MGGACDKFDKSKNQELWQKIFHTQIVGQIKNTYTKKDLILILFTLA